MTRKIPRGRVPSLIGGTNRRPVRLVVQRRSECYRCEDELLAGTSCIAIPQLGGGFVNKRSVCGACYQTIQQKTSDDLEEFRRL